MSRLSLEIIRYFLTKQARRICVTTEGKLFAFFISLEIDGLRDSTRLVAGRTEGDDEKVTELQLRDVTLGTDVE